MINTLSADSADQGDNLDLTLTGSNFLPGITASFGGNGITVNSVDLNSSTSLLLDLSVSADASAGKRSLTLINTDGAYYTKAKAFEVSEAADESLVEKMWNNT